MRPALYYEKLEGGRVRCLLCPHGCVIPGGGRGRCLARANQGGELWAESFGRVTSIALDPIEKKPLRHFHPGSLILSLGSYGCNLRCPFCQNHEISMEEAPWQALAPEEAAALSLQYAPRGNIGLAYTYNEPLIGYEFVRACAELVQGQKQENVLVTNGLIRPEPLKALLPLISAMNIDLKGFTPQFYRDIGGQLEAVQATIAAAAQACHVEVTTLIIPGQNDSPQEMDAMAAWLKGISPGIPLHITRFFPRYKMRDSLPTPPETLRRLAEIAGRHLRHVHLGNL